MTYTKYKVQDGGNCRSMTEFGVAV